jgi:hypothetical protein
VTDEMEHGYSGATPIAPDDPPHACELCGKSGATHVMPQGGYIHLRCGLNRWQQHLAAARARGEA